MKLSVKFLIAALGGLSLLVAACSKVNPEEEPLPNGKLLSTEKITDSQWEALAVTGNVWSLSSRYEFKKGEWKSTETVSRTVFYFRDGAIVSYWVNSSGVMDSGKDRWSYDLSQSELSVGTTRYKMFPNGKDSLFLLKDKELGVLTKLSEQDAAAYRKAR